MTDYGSIYGVKVEVGDWLGRDDPGYGQFVGLNEQGNAVVRWHQPSRWTDFKSEIVIEPKGLAPYFCYIIKKDRWPG